MKVGSSQVVEVDALESVQTLGGFVFIERQAERLLVIGVSVGGVPLETDPDAVVDDTVEGDGGRNVSLQPLIVVDGE